MSLSCSPCAESSCDTWDEKEGRDGHAGAGGVEGRRSIKLIIRLPRFAVPSLLLIHDGPLRELCDQSASQDRAELIQTAKNVNGKVVKRDMRPMLVDEWAKRQPKQEQLKAKL